MRGIEEMRVEMGRLLSKMASPRYPLVVVVVVVVVMVVVVAMVCLCQ